METPLQITFKNFESSDALDAVIRERIARLEKIFDRITSCRVVMEAPGHPSDIYRLSIYLLVPGGEVAVSRDSPSGRTAHKDPYVALRDAFNAAERELKHYAQTRRREVKHLEQPPRGRVLRIVREGEDAYGFIATDDGRELYFHQNSVLNDHFDELQVGTEVRFAEEEGIEGPQASTVEISGRAS